jgi:hypothetical protein
MLNDIYAFKDTTLMQSDKGIILTQLPLIFRLGIAE